MTKNYKKKLKIEANLESNKVLFENEPDPTTILIWWSPEDGFDFRILVSKWPCNIGKTIMKNRQKVQITRKNLGQMWRMLANS